MKRVLKFRSAQESWADEVRMGTSVQDLFFSRYIKFFKISIVFVVFTCGEVRARRSMDDKLCHKDLEIVASRSQGSMASTSTKVRSLI